MLNMHRRGGLTICGPILVGVFVALLSVIMMPAPGLAHRVYVYAWVEGDRIFTESYFSSGDRVRSGQILVFGPKGEKLVEGRTNEKGEFSFPIPQVSDLRIVLNAAMGHRGEYVLKAKELGAKIPEKGKLAHEKQPENTGKSVTVSQGLSEERIRAIVESVLDRRLRPIARSIALLREEKGPGVTEIIGGIGYIIGLVCIALYFKSKGKGRARKKS